jgi:hypothetical protein
MRLRCPGWFPCVVTKGAGAQTWTQVETLVNSTSTGTSEYHAIKVDNTIDYYRCNSPHPPLQKKKSSRKHNFNSVYTPHFKTRRVVRKSSIYRTGVVLKARKIFISTECGVGYHTSKTTIPYQKAHKQYIPLKHCCPDHMLF